MQIVSCSQRNRSSIRGRWSYLVIPFLYTDNNSIDYCNP